ncbi:MAG TPA: MFS transporter [Rhizomicrobium sp.]|jgi:MFS family permease|nr:MFS transporter [Rhizomicrobium sp.]
MAGHVAEQEQPSNAGQVFLYFAPLTMFVYLVMPHGYFLDFTVAQIMKNKLHATPDMVATFRLITCIPVYLSFVFGFGRDLWNPFGMRDRGHFLLFGIVTAAVFTWMAFSPLSYEGLMAGMFLTMASFRFVAAAYQGLLALVGQEKMMSGRLSALWQIMSGLPYTIGGLASGWVADNLEPKTTFLIAALLCLVIAVFAFWSPRAVFAGAYDKPVAKSTSFVGDVKRLVLYRAVYPAVLINFLFNFAPGANTPLQYYLSNTLHASDFYYGAYNAIFAFSFTPMFFLYGWLCRRVSLGTLLWWGTIITVPQMVPLALITTPMQSLVMAALTGLMGGIAAGAYFDLAIRSCPPGLQGTLMMLVDGVLILSSRGGDLLGSWIYGQSPRFGFLYCVIATTAVYAAILPLLLLIPKALIATTDGQRNEEIEKAGAQAVAEAAAAG